MPKVTLAENALAIAELRVFKVNPEDEPTRIKLHFKMPHYNGWVDTKLSTADFWVDDRIQ